jgi:hypothetical protein
MSFIAPNLLEDSDTHSDKGTDVVLSGEVALPDDSIRTSVEDREGIHRESTEKTYNTYRKKLAVFLGTTFDGKKTLPKEVYTDDNISRFVIQLGKDSNYVVSCSSFFISKCYYY